MTNYTVRATRFINQIAPYLVGMNTIARITRAVAQFNEDHHRAVMVFHGATRVALVTSDYVVKFDYSPDVDRYGGCDEEMEFYAYACEQGYGEYLCPITYHMSNGRHFYIMPRATGIGETSLYRSMPERAYDWVTDHIYDLHEDNVGMLNGHAVVIDYALNDLNDPQRRRHSSSYSSSCSTW